MAALDITDRILVVRCPERGENRARAYGGSYAVVPVSRVRCGHPWAMERAALLSQSHQLRRACPGRFAARSPALITLPQSMIPAGPLKDGHASILCIHKTLRCIDATNATAASSNIAVTTSRRCAMTVIGPAGRTCEKRLRSNPHNRCRVAANDG